MGKISGIQIAIFINVLLFIFIFEAAFLYFSKNQSTDVTTVPQIAKPQPETSAQGGSASGGDQPLAETPNIVTPTPEPIVSRNQSVLHNVPFTSQAPRAEWENDVFQYGCEEASILMAMHWVEEKPLSVQEARVGILAMAEFQEKRTGSFYDTSAADTAQLMRDYFDYQEIEVQYNINTDDIKTELIKGNLIIVPVNGHIVNNPFFTSPPPAHMFVVVGYDSETKEFIVNDPGTKHGQSFRYAESVLNAGLQDYPTGHGEPIIQVNKVMIVVKPLATQVGEEYNKHYGNAK